MKRELTHGEVETLLPWFANNALEATERREVTAHIEQCATCREELEFLGDVRAVLRISAAAEQPAPVLRNAGFASLPAELQNRIMESPRNRIRKRVWMPALAASFLAAVGLGVAITVTWLDAPRFQTATSTNTSTSGDRALIAVRFVPQTALAELNGMLRRYDAVVVHGPDNQDRWLLEIPLENASDMETLIPTLSRSAGVESVEIMEVATTVE